MDWWTHHCLTVLTFLPLTGALATALFRRNSAVRGCALTFSVLTLAVAAKTFVDFDPNLSAMQFVERHSWIRSPRIDYHLGLDGLSVLLALLTAFLTPLAILASWTSITTRAKGFFIFLLALETGMIGVFVALDFVLFFLFWEAMLIPMYFLIGVWGHERRVYAAVKFILYTLAGSALMLVGILYLYNLTGTFDVMITADELSSG